MKHLLLFALFLLFTLSFSFAQQTDSRYEGKKVLPFGVVEEIQSEAIGETRILNIYLPQGYDPDSQATYPTIYVLDGSAHEDFPHIAGLVQFMNMYELLPKSIVVGIANVDRYRDFTYPSTAKADLKSIPQSGGSGKFIAFLQTEVQPFISNNYKITSHKTIIGQSLGGLLATEILMKQPDLFDDYIIVSPSLWWDKQKLVKSAEDYFKRQQQLKKRVYVSLGKEHPTMHKVADMLVEAMKTSGNEQLNVYYAPILDEDHATILHKAVYQAFKVLGKKESDK